MPTTTLDDIRARYREGVRAYVDGEGAAKTEGLKRAAAALVDARAHFTTRDGDPDLLGRTMDYRNFVAQANADANMPADLRTRAQTLIRHHLSPMLRERYGAEKLEALGMQKESSVDRNKRRRSLDSRTLSLFNGGGPISDVDDVLRLAAIGRVACDRVVAIDTAEKRDVELAEESLRRLAQAANAAADRVSPA